ncbi:MAG: flavodoxin, partial [Dialister invisus]
FTYEETEKILFSADAFGTFGVLHGSIFSDDTDYEEEYLEEARRYYMSVIAKYGAQVLRTLQKVKSFDVSMVCPLHGPVYRTETDISQMMNLYHQLASWIPEYRSVAICFASAYGNTAFAAQRLAFFLGKKGIRHLKLIDLCTVSVSRAWAEAVRRSHLVLAAPTLNMDIHPMMQNFLHECSAMGLQNRTVSIIGNSSWVPDISVKKITETAGGWKNCTILGDAVNITSAIGAKEDRELEALADILVQDILK